MSQLTRAKVVGFDNWTGGAHHFERLVRPFAEAGLDLTLVHLGSWGNDPGRPASERFGSLEVRDIEWFGRLERIFDEKPAAVLFMSTDTFAHRAFNRYCRQRGVPTLHLYHGVVRVQAVDDGTPYRINPLSQLRFVGSKIGKALRYVWPAYIGALWKTRAPIEEWLRFGRDIFSLAAGKYTRRSAADARTDRCCVYVPADIEHAVYKYGFRFDEVSAVGNPDLIQFGLNASMIGSHLPDGERQQRTPESNEIMYIDTGLLLTGFVFRSAGEFIQHLLETRDELQRQGKHLILKPHPALLRSEIRHVLLNSGLDICSDKEFMARLQRCYAAIVETTSLALVPALLGMPLLLAQYGRLGNLRFGEVLSSYPRARRLTALSSFDSVLAAERIECDPDETSRWIEVNGGPLPAEDMPQRVAETVLRMIGARQELITS